MTRLGLAVLVCAAVCLQVIQAEAAEVVTGTPYVIDVSAGVPVVESNTFNIDGSATVGYSTRDLGFWVHGSFSTFDVLQDQREQTEVKTNVDGEAWYRLGSDKTAGASFGATAALAQYSNDSTYLAPFASTEEASQMVRGSATAGAWLNVPNSLEGRLDAFGGFQREAYLRTAVTGAGSLDDEFRSEFTFRYNARLRLRWLAAPRAFSLNLHGDLEGFSLNRSRALFSYSPGVGFDQQDEVVAAFRLDTTGRVEAVLDWASLWGVSPFVYGQLRYVSARAQGFTIATTVPGAGLGIRSEYF